MNTLNTTVNFKPFVTCCRCNAFNSFILDKPMTAFEILMEYHSHWAITKDGMVCPKCQGILVKFIKGTMLCPEHGDAVVIHGTKYTVNVVMGNNEYITNIGITAVNDDSIASYDLTNVIKEGL